MKKEFVILLLLLVMGSNAADKKSSRHHKRGRSSSGLDLLCLSLHGPSSFSNMFRPGEGKVAKEGLLSSRKASTHEGSEEEAQKAADEAIEKINKKFIDTSGRVTEK